MYNVTFQKFGSNAIGGDSKFPAMHPSIRYFQKGWLRGSIIKKKEMY